MYIVVEGEDPGYNIYVNGRVLARYESGIEKLALELGVKPLLEFFSADENSMALLSEQGAADPEWGKHLPQPQWFQAPEGLLSVRSLIGFLEKNPTALGSQTSAAVSELREYERVRAHPRRFMVHPGHEEPEAERIVDPQSDYLVVEKNDEAGRVAEVAPDLQFAPVG